MGVLEFPATVPNIQSAMKVGPDGVRLQLEIPAIAVPNVLAIVGMMDKVLHVTIQVMEDE